MKFNLNSGSMSYNYATKTYEYWGTENGIEVVELSREQEQEYLDEVIETNNPVEVQQFIEEESQKENA